MTSDSNALVDRRIVGKLLVTYFERNHSKEVGRRGALTKMFKLLWYYVHSDSTANATSFLTTHLSRPYYYIHPACPSLRFALVQCTPTLCIHMTVLTYIAGN